MEQFTPEMMGAGQAMIMTDPPLHGAMRRGFNRLFLPRPVGRYESLGEALVGDILDGVIARGACDFVVEVAARLPMAFICEIMGIPRKDWADLFRWGNMAVGFEDAEYQVESGSAFETRQIGLGKLGSYTTQLAPERCYARESRIVRATGYGRGAMAYCSTDSWQRYAAVHV
jgi:cytochrome P450